MVEKKVGIKVRPNDHWYGGDRSGYFGIIENTYDSASVGPCVLVWYGPNGPDGIEREWIPAACVDVLDGVTVMLLERDGVL